MRKIHDDAKGIHDLKEDDVLRRGKVVTLWAVTSSEDDMEGKLPYIDRSFHLNAKDARVAAKGKGVMGCDADIEARLALAVRVPLEEGKGGATETRYYLAPVSIKVQTKEEAAAAREALLADTLKDLSPAQRAVLDIA